MAMTTVFRRAAISALVILGLAAMGTAAAGQRAVPDVVERGVPAEPVIEQVRHNPPAPPETVVVPPPRPSLLAALAAVSACERPAALLRWAAQTADPEPALALLDARDARLRVAAIIAVRGLSERPAVAQALDRRRALEPDPRVRQAIAEAGDQVPDWVHEEPRITLPIATAQAPARRVDVMWDPRHAGGAPASRTTIEIDREGRVVVDTTSDHGGNWHVRYAGWAWRDAQGNLVIDARNQAVEQIIAPAYAQPGTWSPDSFIIAPDGQCRTVDDREQRCLGAAAVPGAG